MGLPGGPTASVGQPGLAPVSWSRKSLCRFECSRRRRCRARAIHRSFVAGRSSCCVGLAGRGGRSAARGQRGVAVRLAPAGSDRPPRGCWGLIDGARRAGRCSPSDRRARGRVCDPSPRCCVVEGRGSPNRHLEVVGVIVAEGSPRPAESSACRMPASTRDCHAARRFAVSATPG
jgi:hypothetical protein